MHEGKIIVLDAPINNPRPDGRKRNWTGEKQFPAGRYIVGYSGCVHRSRGSRYDRLDAYGNKEGRDALIAAAHEVAPHGIKETLAVIGDDDGAESILGLLLQNGTITIDQIRAVAKQLDETEGLYETV